MSTSGAKSAGRIELPALQPESLFARARNDVLAIVRYRELVRYSVLASLRTENIGTVLGFVWWLLDPLLLMAVYVVLVDVILERGGPDYPIFVLTAVVAWQFFTKATRNGMNTTARKDRLMRQVPFPRSVLPLSSALAESVHLLFGLAVLVLVAIPFGIHPHPVNALVLFVVAVQFTLTLGVAYFFSALNVFFRDTGHLLNYLLRFWFFLSPTLYAVSDVPAAYRDLYEVNPYATILPAYRSVLMEHAAPDFAALAIVAVAAAAVLALGYLFFVRLERAFTKVSY